MSVLTFEKDFTESDWELHRRTYCFHLPYLSRGYVTINEITYESQRDGDILTVTATTEDPVSRAVSRIQIPKYAIGTPRIEHGQVKIEHGSKTAYDEADQSVMDAIKALDVPRVKDALRRLRQVCVEDDPRIRDIAELLATKVPSDVAGTISGDWTGGQMYLIIGQAHQAKSTDDVLVATLEAFDIPRDLAGSIAKKIAVIFPDPRASVPTEHFSTVPDGWEYVGQAAYFTYKLYVRSAYLRYFGLSRDEVMFGDKDLDLPWRFV
jgi:hypothetical protein